MTCGTCDGSGLIIEFRRFAGEYQAGEPYEIVCPDCDGESEEDEGTPMERFQAAVDKALRADVPYSPMRFKTLDDGREQVAA